MYIRYPLITLVVSYVAVSLLTTIVLDICLVAPETSGTYGLIASTAEGAISSVLTLLILVIFIPTALGIFPGRKDGSTPHKKAKAKDAANPNNINGSSAYRLPERIRFSVKKMGIAYVMFAAVLAMCIESWFGGYRISIDILQGLLLLVGISATTAIYEEAMFRGIFVPCLFVKFRDWQASSKVRPASLLKNPWLMSALVSAVIFGLLHLLGSDFAEVAAPEDALSVFLMALSGILKFVQSGLFGFVMAAIFMDMRSIWVPTLIHGLFNFCYFLPEILIYGELPTTYLSADPVNLVILAVTVIILIPASWLSWKLLQRQVPEGIAKAKSRK
ncbi:MAG: CPBP family intramembrane metalloprotease [Eggerthellaceae bacterium]|nr:CPBP family intramembrane metalloprotease [Eggerthellaceae bacterium]